MNNRAIETPHAGKRLQEWRDSWGVVLAAAIGVGISGMHVHFVGTLIKPFELAYGWTRAEVAFGLTLMQLVAPLTYVLSGMLCDRFGARRVALTGVWGFGIGFGLMGLAGPALWTWYAACLSFAFLALACGAIVWSTVVVKRFVHARGLALALSLAGGGFMVSITPMLVLFLVEFTGIRGVFFTISICGTLLMFIPAYFFFHDEKVRGKSEAAAIRSSTPLPGHTVAEALRSRPFWWLAIALFLVASCIGLFVAHLQPMLMDAGLTAQSAASIAFFMGPAMIIGRISIGFLFDIFECRTISAIAFIIPSIACFMLLQLDGNYAMAAVTAVFIGLGMGAEVDVIAYLTSRYFGLRRYGVLFAILVAVNAGAIGLSSVIAGVVFDSLHSYQPMLMVLGIGAIIATLLAATMGKPTRTAEGLTIHGAH
ncbi:MAG: MFS transporter [Spongiibacteraceae bacterium]